MFGLGEEEYIVATRLLPLRFFPLVCFLIHESSNSTVDGLSRTNRVPVVRHGELCVRQGITPTWGEQAVTGRDSGLKQTVQHVRAKTPLTAQLAKQDGQRPIRRLRSFLSRLVTRLRFFERCMPVGKVYLPRGYSLFPTPPSYQSANSPSLATSSTPSALPASSGVSPSLPFLLPLALLPRSRNQRPRRGCQGDPTL